MIIKGEFVEEGNTTVFYSRCEICNDPADKLSLEEVQALAVGLWGPVRCKSCDDKTCPTCGFTMIDARAITYLKEMGECFFCRMETEERVGK